MRSLGFPADAFWVSLSLGFPASFPSLNLKPSSTPPPTDWLTRGRCPPPHPNQAGTRVELQLNPEVKEVKENRKTLKHIKIRKKSTIYGKKVIFVPMC